MVTNTVNNVIRDVKLVNHPLDNIVLLVEKDTS